MLSPVRCPGPEEVEPEEVGLEEVGPEEVHDRRKCTTGGSARVEGVHDWRECKSEGSVQVEEGRSSRRKVRSWT